MKVLIAFLLFGASAMSALLPVDNLALPLPLAGIQGYNGLAVPPGSLRFSTRQAAYPQYLVYSVPQINTGVRTISAAVFSNGRPAIAQIPTTYNYYGTPIYDFRFPINPVFSGVKPVVPGQFPKPMTPPAPPTYPSSDNDDDDDGIEKLDEKAQPGSIDNSSNESDESSDDDTVTINAA